MARSIIHSAHSLPLPTPPSTMPKHPPTAPPLPTPPVPAPTTSSDEAGAPSLDDVFAAAQWVYGTASVDVSLRDSRVVAKGEHVLLCYPMVADDDGRVLMMCKTVDPVTAQIHMESVAVFDPTVTPTHRFANFRLTP